MDKINLKKTGSEVFQEMKNFCQEKLNREVLDYNVVQVFNYLKERDYCTNCESLLSCKQNNKGLYPYILEENNDEIIYKSCKYKKIEDAKIEIDNNFEILNMPPQLKKATLINFNRDTEERRNLFNHACEMLNLYPNIKGLYLHGSFRSGKTYYVAALLNEFSKKGIKSILLYYPDLVRIIKDQYNVINKELFQKLLDVEILAIDDLGSENNSVLSRDEILSPLLQHRLLFNKLTIITTNYSYMELKKFLASEKTDAPGQMKAVRICERIQTLCDTFTLNGNYEEKNKKSMEKF